MIGENATVFGGLPVEDFDVDKGIQRPTEVAYRLRIDWEEYEANLTILSKVQAFLQDPNVGQVPALVIGAWGGVFEGGDDSAQMIEALCAGHDKLTSLKHLFIGDITYEESEISWIGQSNIGPLWRMFPQLVELRVRGGNGLSLGDATHESLETLIVEAGGLPRNVVREVASGHLPALNHLELWLGTSEYGGDATIDDVAPILQGDRFPELQYLGLRDSEITDQIAAAVPDAPIVERLKVLDLSKGTLGDEGAGALLGANNLGGLDKLDLHHHYMSDDMMTRLQQRMAELGVEVNLDEQEEEEEYGRYVAVSE